MTDGIYLGEFANGTAQQQFERALREVMENIMDPRTKPDETRVITMQIKIKPDQSRTLITTSVETQTKLSNPKSKTGMYIRRDGSGMRLVELEKGQIEGQTKFDPETGEIMEEGKDLGKIRTIG